MLVQTQLLPVSGGLAGAIAEATNTHGKHACMQMLTFQQESIRGEHVARPCTGLSAKARVLESGKTDAPLSPQPSPKQHRSS